MRVLSALSALAVAALVLALGPPPAGAQDGEPTVATGVVESFDGTGIYTTLFLPPGAGETTPVPIVFRGHGWGGRGERAVTEGGTLDKLLDAGYAVLTWDERGFGDSGDVAHVMSPDFERKDVQVLIDTVAAMPEILKEAPGDPVLGMTGGSYGGGYQLVTSAFDDRIDAIAPEITWVDLNYSLAPSGVPKLGWGQLLFGYGLVGATFEGLDPRFNSVETGNYEPALYETWAKATATNTFDEPSLEYYAARSIVGYGQANQVDVPALVIQGSVDTLFNINEGLAIFDHIRGNGAPAKYMIFCGGHVACPASYEDAGDRDYLDAAILAWFAKYLRGEDVDTGAPVEYRTNEGVWHSLPGLPAPNTQQLPVTGEATLVSTPIPHAQGAALNSAPNGPGPTGASFEVAVAEGGPLEIVGIPKATLQVAGQGPTVHLFIKLVDREAGEVLNLQEAAIRVTDLSSEAQTIELDLVGVAYTLPEGHHLDLQISTASLMHANARTPAQADVTIEATVPVLVAPAAPAPPPAEPAPEHQPAAQPAPQPAPASSGTLPTTGGGRALAALPLLALALVTLRRRLR